MSDRISVHDAVADIMANRTQVTEDPAHDEPQAEEQEQQAALDSQSHEPEGNEDPQLDADSPEEVDGEPLNEHDETESEDDEEPGFTVIVNGTETEVTLEELQKGYMREADYTRSKQAVAEQSKAVQAQAEQANGRLGQMDAQLAAIDQMFFGTPPEQPPIDLMRSDPASYEEQKRFFEQWHVSKQTLDQQRQAIVQQQTQEVQTKRQETAQAEAQKFLQAFPDVKDEVSFTAKVGELQHFATQYGYEPQELAGMIDHRAYRVLAELKALKEAVDGSKDKTRQKIKRGKVKPISSGRGQKASKLSVREKANQRFDQTVNRGGSGYSRKDSINAAVAAFTAKD